MKALHKSTTCFLLCLAAVPFIFSVYFQTRESIIHHEMREALEKNNLITIEVNTTAVTWTEPGKEAIINGKMFDVEKFTIEDSEIQLVGLFDNDEDTLFTQLDNQEESKSEATGSALLLKWFSCFSWVQNRELNDFLSAEKSCTNPSLQQYHIESPSLSCETPPPEVFI